MKYLFIVLALAIALPAAAGDDHETLRALLDEFLAGASVNDATMHERFWAEDLVYTSSSGERFGKQAIMEGLSETEDASSRDAPEGPRYSAEDVNIRQFGETGVITFRLVAEQEGRPRAEYFNTGVFRNREGQWRAVAWQATRTAGPREERP